MKLIVGLGNPGKQYENTRHNVGYMVIDKLSLALRAKLKTQKLKIKNMIVTKTNVFMNESGRAVKKLMENGKWKMENLYVIHDDLDIPLGQFKIQFAKGPKDHKGIQSIEGTLGTNEFWRVRVGVDNRDPSDRIPGEEYVLQEWTSQEYEIVNRVIKQVTREIIRWIREE